MAAVSVKRSIACLILDSNYNSLNPHERKNNGAYWNIPKNDQYQTSPCRKNAL